MKKTLLVFKQNGCNPCTTLDNMMKYDFEVEADETFNLSTDGDDALDTAGQYGVMTTPLMVLVGEDGKEEMRYAGADKAKVKEVLLKRGLLQG